MSPKDIIRKIDSKKIEFIDFRFTDTSGLEHHISIPRSSINEEKFKFGQNFDGSSIDGWKSIESSDMLLVPDINTAKIDPFRELKTMIIKCDVYETKNQKNYNRDPRSLSKRAETYLKESGIGEKIYFGPEPEFFIFDSIKWKYEDSNIFVDLKSKEFNFNLKEDIYGYNKGNYLSIKGGYSPVPPFDSFQDFRSEVSTILEQMGIPVEIHHHEVAGQGQLEIGTKFSTLTNRADWNCIMKYIIRNTAKIYGKTATFMPKPIIKDNGSGMHIHQSIWKNNKNIFFGNNYSNLSDTAIYYIGGIIKHAKALNAITNPGTNSYKRLIPNFEAPVNLNYSSQNRSAAIRIPHFTNQKNSRIEVRFPDGLANPYLAFSALMMAGIDGIKNKIHPGNPTNKNLYNISIKEKHILGKICSSLEESLYFLDKDRNFLLRGNVFNNDMIDAYITLKMKEVKRIKDNIHPLEFDMYYNL